MGFYVMLPGYFGGTLHLVRVVEASAPEIFMYYYVLYLF